MPFPVSYTHLDVYKRQLVDVAHQAAIGSTITRGTVLHLGGEVVDVGVKDTKQRGLLAFHLGEPPAMVSCDNARIVAGIEDDLLAATTAMVLDPDPVLSLIHIFTINDAIKRRRLLEDELQD